MKIGEADLGSNFFTKRQSQQLFQNSNLSNITINGREKYKINYTPYYESNLSLHSKVRKVINVRSKTNFDSYVELSQTKVKKQPNIDAMKKSPYGLEEPENQPKLVVKRSKVLLDVSHDNDYNDHISGGVRVVKSRDSSPSS